MASTEEVQQWLKSEAAVPAGPNVLASAVFGRSGFGGFRF
jgi:hypothetical protein